MKAAIIVTYLVVVTGIGILARRRAQKGATDFFLAGRSIGPVLLLLTMAATNFSAFTVFGFAGAGYRFGYAYYPIMGFGTGFMALTFLFIGIPVWQAGLRLGAVSPPELIWLRFRNRPLRAAYLLVMIVFTLPYLAIQPMGAGYALEGLLGIPYVWGAVAVTLVVVGYVLLGGMRGVVWTDALQGLLMLGAMAAVFFGLAKALAGFETANARVFSEAPELFSRPGGAAQFTLGIWFSYMVLWFLCDPMFPQLFQRFLAAKSERSLRLTALLYPLVTGVLFFLPVAVGVMGRLIVPGLEGKATDQVLPLAVAKTLPAWMGAIAIGAGLTALMSTMDSQLLTLGSMFSRDVRQLAAPRGHRFVHRRLVVAVLALVGLVLALRPVATILQIATEAFTGLAVLFPVTVAGIYWKRTNPWAGLASILVGEGLVVLYHYKLLPTFGLLPVIPVVLAAGLVLVFGSLVWPARGLEPLAEAPRAAWRWVMIFGIVFALGIDFWNWGRAQLSWLGLPGWVWYHFGLCLLVSVLIGLYFLVQRRQRAV
ncbi:MAG: sodium:solute symporter family protein [candidate division WOR-3 bacterium]|nr:MAG: sodium:solute symporter family protein [candidate division WOR-3 bacterium]